MRSFNFLLLIQYSFNFSIFVIKEDTLETDNHTILGTRNISDPSKNSEISEASASGSGESGSGHLEPVAIQEDKYPPGIIVRDAFPICEYGFKGEVNYSQILSFIIKYKLYKSFIMTSVSAVKKPSMRIIYVDVLRPRVSNDLDHVSSYCVLQ